MKIGDREIEGFFEVIESFAIRKREQFYLIGKINEGRIEEGWFVYVPFNSTFGMTIRINAVEEIEMSKENHTLLIVDCDDEAIDFFMALNIELERLPITKEGQD